MAELIKITEQNGQKAVNARELHIFLESKQQFSDWIKNRIKEYGFIEGQDFEVFQNFMKNSEGGRPAKEYALSLDMAKELSMVEKTEKGRQARRYFIEMEQRAKNHSLNLLKENKNRELQSELFALIRANLMKGDLIAVAQEYGFNKNTVKSVMYNNTYSPEIVKALHKKALSNKNYLRNELEQMINELKL
ncbi:MAG: antA/AntB antirepressor family protein [Bacteroidota bacterium]|nr:antA/AntB antirepressor family protein [Bacteroidota bacterium]